MDWVQVYDPLGSPLWSTLLATLPVVFLLGLLAAGLDAAKSALAGLIIALAIAILGIGMPATAAFASAGYGACFGLLDSVAVRQANLRGTESALRLKRFQSEPTTYACTSSA